MKNTPYDDVFRTLLNDCSQLIIPIINETFHEGYSGNEEIIFLPMRGSFLSMIKMNASLKPCWLNMNILRIRLGNYDRVKEGVKSVMGGKVLDYEAKRLQKSVEEFKLLL